MWNGLRSYDIYTALSPLHFACKIMGLAPYSHNNKTQVFDLLWTALWMCVYVLGMCNQVTQRVASETSEKYAVIKLLYIVCHYSTSFAYMSRVTLGRKNIGQILTNFIKTDAVCFKPEERINLYKRHLIFHITEIVALIIIQACLFYCNILVFTTEIYAPITENICFLSNSLVMAQYVSYVLFLQQRCKRLNLWLSDFSCDLKETSIRVATNRSFIFHIDNFEMDAEDFRLPACKETIETHLHYIHQIYIWRRVYSQLHDNIALMNSTFGSSLLVSIVWIITALVYVSYTALYMLHHLVVNQWNVGEYNVMIGYASWGFFFLFLLMCVTVSSHLAVDEARKSSLLIHKLILRPDLRVGIVKELMQFAAQLKVMQVKFTACGFFAIDLPLLSTVIGVTCTYIIIMIQLS
jgi:hypothetical protein